MDNTLREALETIDNAEVDTLLIRRGDEEIPIFILMSSLVESLLIFHGKLSVYAQLGGIVLPESWSRFA